MCRRRGAAPAATLDAARTAADVIEQTQAARRAERDALLQRKAEGAVFVVEAVEETLRRSNLGALAVGDAVDVERPIDERPIGSTNGR